MAEFVPNAELRVIHMTMQAADINELQKLPGSRG
jgi:hypothetical protein